MPAFSQKVRASIRALVPVPPVLFHVEVIEAAIRPLVFHRIPESERHMPHVLIE